MQNLIDISYDDQNIRREVAEFYNDRTVASSFVRGSPKVLLRRNRGPAPALPPNCGRIMDELGLDLSHLPDEERRQRFWKPAYALWSPQEDKNMPGEVMDQSLETGFKDFRLHWKKVVGQGGWGIATLWEVEFEDGYRQDIIIKMDASHGHQKFSDELDWHLRYNEAFRIVQSCNLVEMANRHRRRKRFQRGVEFDPRELNVLVLEYMQHGNLFDILQKASLTGKQFPKNALWQLWACLVEGIAEVAYQNEFRQRFNVSFLDMFRDAEAGGPAALERFFEQVSDVPISHDVHFDLEESNILASRDYAGNIIFKLHDFGDRFSFRMRRAWENWDEQQYWKSQINGQTWQEQNVKEWESIPLPNEDGAFPFQSDNFDIDGKTEVAGRYGSWTNVFTIARTLQSAITLCSLVHPFTTRHLPEDDPEPTYGWRLHPNSWPNVDPMLIATLLRCMRERPVSRPSLVDLLRGIARARAAGKMDNDRESNAFWEEVLLPLDNLIRTYGVGEKVDDYKIPDQAPKTPARPPIEPLSEPGDQARRQQTGRQAGRENKEQDGRQQQTRQQLEQQQEGQGQQDEGGQDNSEATGARRNRVVKIRRKLPQERPAKKLAKKAATKPTGLPSKDKRFSGRLGNRKAARRNVRFGP